jgi:hypothetical protein
MPDDQPAPSTNRQRYAGPERRSLPRGQSLPKTLGWAQPRSGISSPGLRAGEWYPVLERHTERGLSSDGYALPGYVWLKVNGRLTHWREADLEFRHTDPDAGA